MRFRVVYGVLAMAWISTALGGEIDFVEDFVFAKDRAEVLKQLIPGTEDHSYYSALHAIQTEQYKGVEQILTEWVKRHGETQRVWEIRTRLALATYDKNPEKSLEYLRNRLGIHYFHQKEELNAEPNLPSSLDLGQISREAFINRANAVTTDNTELFEESALDWLVGYELGANHRRSLLSRLTRSDYPKLVKQVIDDLNQDDSGGFGSLAIHRQMLLPQLEEIVKAKPELLNQQQFVQAYLTKLQPTADEDWQRDPKLRAAYLERLTRFADRLSPVHNTLKAHVLYYRLVLDRQNGEYRKDRFIEYLKLPRRVGYLSRRMAESDSVKRFAGDLTNNYAGVTLLPPIGNDEPLVRSYLLHLLQDEASTKEFEPYINDVYLKQLFAEVKIVNGLGNAEQWSALLPAVQFQSLKERVDLDFSVTNKTQFAPDEPVKLELFIKNVNTLIVKVFEINTQAYYRQNQKEVDTDISLDGLVAHVEQTHHFDESPLRRVPRKFEFPQLDRTGVYIVDFIGNGRSSRALIRKGRLRHLVRTIPEGQLFTILDDKNDQVKDATLWLSGHEYRPGSSGEILVPFSSESTRQAIVLTHNGLASLDHFQHEAENYSLVTGFYVDRESLLKNKKAELVVRAGLTLNGTRISVNRLKDVKLNITSVDLDGISSSKEIAEFKLFEDRDSTHEFPVPARLASLTFLLTAKTKRQSDGGGEVDLTATDNFTLNGVDNTDKIQQLHLARFNDEYVLELRGKTGEARASRPVLVTLKHRDFRQAHSVSLKTDAGGRIQLGRLQDIVDISATVGENESQAWHVAEDAHTYRQSVHSQVGETISLPYLPRTGSARLNQGQDKALAPTRDELSLLEVRSDVFSIDRFENLSIQDGLLRIKDLPAGDFDLFLKGTGNRIRLRVADGPSRHGYVLGRQRQLELPPAAPVQIASIVPVESGLKIHVMNGTPLTRVHVYATRYLPEYGVYVKLSRVRWAEPYLIQQSHADSAFLTGRNIGDEYRYIIDRRYATKFPGNTLERPSLLLNPWAIRETQTGTQLAVAGDDFAAAGPPPTSAMAREESTQNITTPQTPHRTNLDFLATGSAVLLNLVPNENGLIEIEQELLGPHQHIHVVAVDPINTTFRSISLPEQKANFRDLRLASGLDAKGHFTQQKQISTLASGQTFILSDVTTSRFEAYDSLKRVLRLYATLNNDPKLNEFSFLLDWPTLSQEERRKNYSQYACHELSIFLSRKDPEFFRDVIRPYLANKKDKTFLDQYLLDQDLGEFLEPWKFAQLNVAERVLLAQRIQEQRASTARHIRELYALLPPNPDHSVKLFETAVRRSSLELGDAFGVKQTEDQLRIELNFSNGLGGSLNEGAMGGAGGMAMGMGMGGGAEARSDLKSEKLKAGALFKRRHGGSWADADRKKDEAKDSPVDELKENLGRSPAFPLPYLRDAEAFDVDDVRQLYRKLEKTKEWAENNYHRLLIQQQTAGLVSVNGFWNDYANHDPAAPFLSRHLAEASRNFTEMLLALAVLDLPFDSPQHQTEFDGPRMTLKSHGPIVIFHEEIRPVAAADGTTKVLVSQNFFRHGDRLRMEGGEQFDKFIQDEFLTQVVYGCQVVLTNPTSTRQKLSVLLQIPGGSIPVSNGQPTRTVLVDLEPFHTRTLDYYFYFPVAGQFQHFPVHVARNEVLIASAEPILFNVVEKPTRIDTGSWDYISQYASQDDVLAFLDQQNIAALNLDRIAWRMRDRGVFAATLARLTERHLYQHTLWSYALMHNDVPRIREFLQYADQITNDCGGRIKSPLLTIDPVERKTFEHLEYKPLVNARAHSLGKRRQIVNDQFHAQYHRTLKQLSYEKKLGSQDLLTLTHYLLLQDRIEEALSLFAQVDVEQISTRIQYDYCAAYLDFFNDDHKRARGIASRYSEFPVDRWRQAFASIIAQLDEAEGQGVGPVDAEDRNQQQSVLAATEPALEFVVEARQIRLETQNLKSVTVNFYEMDVELLFSSNPFVQQFRGEFNSIKPNSTLQVELTAQEGSQPGTPRVVSKTVPLPEALHNKNVLVEVVGAGLAKSHAYYSNSLTVQVIENYGQIKVTQQKDGRPVPKAYVKVYAQLSNGDVQFYKDGYTDLRGRFDYASLSTDGLETATKFSILVLSDEFGATVKEATPPKQ
ncbi:hypothetical protein [Schlesneria sp.]|uniref:hypothetical protein n=1 Tax=Schlesneria sp. TaxID=2762018 RepID=UPI002F052DB9